MYPLHARRRKVFPNITVAAVVLLTTAFQSVYCDINLSAKDISLKLHEQQQFSLKVGNITNACKVAFIVQHNDIVKISPSSIAIVPNISNYNVTAEGTNAGHSEVTVNTTDGIKEHVYIRITVYKTAAIDTISIVIGWIYFAAWSISFYPQIYSNYKRKSVIGLNFDFLSLNLVGFALYSVFNLGLYFIPEVEDEYFKRYPRGLNPVQINDIFFAVHASVASMLTIAQCCIYERGGQKVSFTARGILAIFAAFLFISFILSTANVLHWLDFLYFCSYVKLTITLIKYVPQAYMNYKRRSTVGWSIGNILLDFTGGILSMLQMILSSYNYNDWVSIFGDPTKFGLGLFSVVFDIFFIIQHYILYRHTSYEPK